MHMNNVDKKALRWKFKPIQICLIFLDFVIIVFRLMQRKFRIILLAVAT